MNTLGTINVIFCASIFVLGLWAYRRTRRKTPLLISLSFALFGIGRLIPILGFRSSMADLILILETLGYLIMLSAVSRILSKHH